MNNIKLKSFQEKAINSIVTKLKTDKVVKLQSPTGSGKTLMTAKIIEKFLKNYDEEFFQKTSVIYISLSSGELDYQGYTKINKLLSNNFVSGFDTKYIGTSSKKKNADLKTNNYIQGIEEFKKNTVYFMGWGILTANSKSFKDGEEDNIFNIIRRTKTAGTKIMLVIDEAHRDNPLADTTKSTSKERVEFLNELNPDKQLWMSATFLSLKKPIKPDYIVSSEEVRADGVIKQNIIINDEVESEWNDDSANKKLVKTALIKKREIQKSILKAAQKFNPLILIQIPDGNPKFNNISVNDYYLKIIERILQAEGLVKGLDYGIYLDKIKTNTKSEIESMSSPLQVIIFKQAIATGWDVPRANILVKLRKPSSRTESFELQTLGRILRNPYLKVYKRGGSFTNVDIENLNNAFVYTNDKDYASFIANETNNGEGRNLEKDTFKLSKKASDLKLKLNYLKIRDIEARTWDEIQIKLLHNEKFIGRILNNIEEFHNQETHAIAERKSFDGGLASEGVLKENSQQQSFDLDENKKNKEDLYYIYIEFLQAIDGLKIIETFVKSLVKRKECKYKIKDIYLYFIDKYNDIFEDEITLKQKINDILYELISENIKYDIGEEFTLSDQMSYYKELISKVPVDFEQETLINSYLMDINTTIQEYKPTFDSLQEHLFYNWFKGWKWRDAEKSKIHLFRNGINPINSYFIEYIDIQSMKTRRFFPDFIITTKTKNIILEVKGIGRNNVDIKAETKLKAASQDLKKMNPEKEVLVFKVGSSKTPKNDGDLICFQYINGEKSESYKLDFLKETILKD
ncbi:MAG: DEAD/DEAH box helicase family protein [Mycoplasmatales bacterium]|nr:DEAD/DEAH box helicase family protein [Mycoplasmatales bacterium]